MLWDITTSLQELLPLGNPFPLGNAPRVGALIPGCLNLGRAVTAAITEILLVHNILFI